MSDPVNKQKKTQSQRNKAYYGAQFAVTLKNKQKKIAKAQRLIAQAAAKKARRLMRRGKRARAMEEIVRISEDAGLYDTCGIKGCAKPRGHDGYCDIPL